MIAFVVESLLIYSLLKLRVLFATTHNKINSNEVMPKKIDIQVLQQKIIDTEITIKLFPVSRRDNWGPGVA